MWFCFVLELRWTVKYVYGILVGCAQTAAVGDPMEVIGFLFFLCA